MSTAPASHEHRSKDRALSGIHVVALEAAVAGPFCSSILADMGADVIKIERPGSGDLIRGWDAVVRGLSSGFVWVNRNKRSITVNVRHPAGQAIVQRLAARADVFLENFAPGVADRQHLGYADLAALNPRLVYCSLSGYGQDGPYRDVKAYDLLIQGEAGLMATTGYPDRPAKVGVPISDLAAGMYAAAGILLALFQRERTGRGQRIDVSMFESVLAWLGYFPYQVWYQGVEPGRSGMHHHTVVPYGPFVAKDGRYVNFAVASSVDWSRFCTDVLQRPDLKDDPRFETADRRLQHREDLESLVTLVFATRDHQEWLARLQAAGLSCGQLRPVSDALDHPQVWAREIIQEIGSSVGPIKTIASPLRLSQSAPRYDRVPDLGEDTASVLNELGYTEDSIQTLRRQEVI